MSPSHQGQEQSDGAVRKIELTLDRFAGEALEQQSEELGVPEHEIVRYALLYYLADLDSGRIARRIAGAPSTRDAP